MATKMLERSCYKLQNCQEMPVCISVTPIHILKVLVTKFVGNFKHARCTNFADKSVLHSIISPIWIIFEQYLSASGFLVCQFKALYENRFMVLVKLSGSHPYIAKNQPREKCLHINLDLWCCIGKTTN